MKTDKLLPEDVVALARNQVLYTLGQQTDEFIVEKLREGYMGFERELEMSASVAEQKELKNKMKKLREEITSEANSKGSAYKFVKLNYAFDLTIAILRFGTHFRAKNWFAVKKMSSLLCGSHGEVSRAVDSEVVRHRSSELDSYKLSHYDRWRTVSPSTSFLLRDWTVDADELIIADLDTLHERVQEDDDCMP